MKLSLGQTPDYGLDTSAVAVNPNPTVPSGITLDSLPLSPVGASYVAPAVVPIPCQPGQTCSYIGNVPDWVIYVGAMAAVLIPLFLTRNR
jgi:hypothetical protein